MKLGNFKPVNRADQPQVPEWAEKFVKPINKTLKDLTTMGQQQISLFDNCNIEARKLKVKHLQTYEVTLNTLKGMAVGCLGIWNSINDFQPVLKFEIVTEKKVKVTPMFVSSPPPTGEVEIQILVIGK